MPAIQTGVAAATAVVGYDMYTGESMAEIPAGARVVAVAVTGSAVIGDSRVEFKAGNDSIAKVYNSALLVGAREALVPAVWRNKSGAAQHLFCTVLDAPATSVLYALAIVDQS